MDYLNTDRVAAVSDRGQRNSRLSNQAVWNSDSEGMERLYEKFAPGLRSFFLRQLGPQDAEDKVQDVLLITLEALREGRVRELERLPGYVRTVAKRSVAACIEERVRDRNCSREFDASSIACADNPESSALDHERAAIMQEVLRGLSAKDRRVLVGFYLQEQTQEQICRDMNLTATQFRMLKWRAKAHFAELCRDRIAWPRRKAAAA